MMTVAHNLASLQIVDLVHLLSYDFHGPWEAYTHHIAPLYAHPLDQGLDALLNVVRRLPNETTYVANTLNY